MICRGVVSTGIRGIVDVSVADLLGYDLSALRSRQRALGLFVSVADLLGYDLSVRKTRKGTWLLLVSVADLLGYDLSVHRPAVLV